MEGTRRMFRESNQANLKTICTVTIPSKYKGPPDIANGGYVCTHIFSRWHMWGLEISVFNSLLTLDDFLLMSIFDVPLIILRFLRRIIGLTNV